MKTGRQWQLEGGQDVLARDVRRFGFLRPGRGRRRGQSSDTVKVRKACMGPDSDIHICYLENWPVGLYKIESMSSPYAKKSPYTSKKNRANII